MRSLTLRTYGLRTVAAIDRPVATGRSTAAAATGTGDQAPSRTIAFSAILPALGRRTPYHPPVGSTNEMLALSSCRRSAEHIAPEQRTDSDMTDMMPRREALRLAVLAAATPSGLA